MKSKRSGGPVDRAVKRLTVCFIMAGIGLVSASPALADQPVQPTPPPTGQPAPAPAQPAPQPVQPQTHPVPGPVPPPAQQKSPELTHVEGVMGRPLEREYSRYLAMNPQPQDERFAAYLYDTYESKRLSGILMAGVFAPIFASATVSGTLLLYLRGRDDNGGFCNHVTRDDGEYQRDCQGDRGELAGMIVISTFGGILTLAMLIPGALRSARYGRRLRRLEHLAGAPGRTPVSFTYAISPKEVSLGFHF